MALGVISYDDGPIPLVSLRPAIHDLYDLSQSHQIGRALRVFETDISFGKKAAKPVLHRLDLVDVYALRSWNPVLRPVSWRAGARYQRRSLFSENPRFEAFGLAGLSTSFHKNRTLVYGLLGALSRHSSRTSLALASELGVLYANGSYVFGLKMPSSYGLDDQVFERNLSFTSGFQMGEQTQLRFSLSLSGARFRESSIQAVHYL